MWIDVDLFMPPAVGAILFLVQRYDWNTGRTAYDLLAEPPRTNESGDARLRGQCGSYNGRGIDACGLARVVRVGKAGGQWGLNRRAQVVRLVDGEQESEALHALGWCIAREKRDYSDLARTQT
jgi:hypothetical protein